MILCSGSQVNIFNCDPLQIMT